MIAQARAKGMSRIQGRFLPTKKNAPAKDFYQKHGFNLETQDDQGFLWARDLTECELSCPEWIRLIVGRGDS